MRKGLGRISLLELHQSHSRYIPSDWKLLSLLRAPSVTKEGKNPSRAEVYTLSMYLIGDSAEVATLYGLLRRRRIFIGTASALIGVIVVLLYSKCCYALRSLSPPRFIFPR